MTFAPRSKGERPFEEGSQGWAALDWQLCLWLKGKPGGAWEAPALGEGFSAFADRGCAFEPPGGAIKWGWTVGSAPKGVVATAADSGSLCWRGAVERRVGPLRGTSPKSSSPAARGGVSVGQGGRHIGSQRSRSHAQGGREGGVGQEEKGPSAEATTPLQAAEVATCAAEGRAAAQLQAQVPRRAGCRCTAGACGTDVGAGAGAGRGQGKMPYPNWAVAAPSRAPPSPAPP